MKLAVAAALALTAGAASQLSAQSPASGPAPDRFMLFFDWGKADINRDSAAILDSVAAAYRRSPNVRILLSGHADRSGAASHNLRSSRRRVDAARAYLAERGIPAGAMATAAIGEDQAIVPTEDGVREAQNRRVEITFSPRPGE